MTDIKTKIHDDTLPATTTGLEPGTKPRWNRGHGVGGDGIEAELENEPKPEVKAQLKPEVKAELKRDVRTTLEEMAETGRSVDERFARRVRINSPRRHNAKLNALLNLINTDDDLYGLWLAANVNAMERLGMTDHGPVHVKIVMNIGLKMLRLLTERGVVAGGHPQLSDDGRRRRGGGGDGVAAPRSRHVDPPRRPRVVLAVPRSVEARTAAARGLRCQARGDRALRDPARDHFAPLRRRAAHDRGWRRAHRRRARHGRGRSRIPFEHGSQSIHSISAAAIDSIAIDPGVDKAVRISVRMTNSAGVFQLDRLFREKLQGSGLESYIELEASIEGETEKRLIRTFKV